MDENTKTETISRLYDQGAGLEEIVRAIGTDPASVRLVGYRLGLSTRPGTKLDYAVRRVNGEAV